MGKTVLAYRIECFRLCSLPENIRRAWCQLIYENADVCSAFLTPTFCDAAKFVGADVRVITIKRDNRILGVLPFQFKHGIMGRLRIAERVGGEMSDYFGVVAEIGLRFDTRELLCRSGISALEFSHLGEAQIAFGLKGDSARIGLCIDIGSSGAVFWNKLRLADKKLVADTERRAKKLTADYGKLSFELQSTRPEEDLKFLIGLKLSQYERTGKVEAALLQNRNQKLLQQLLTVSDPACKGVLSVLRAGDRLVSAHFGLQCHNTLHYWFPVYDDEFKAYSPGRLLLMNLLIEGPPAGIEIIDRGEGDAPHKRDFANRQHHFYRGVWNSDGFRGILGRTALSMAWRLNI